MRREVCQLRLVGRSCSSCFGVTLLGVALSEHSYGYQSLGKWHIEARDALFAQDKLRVCHPALEGYIGLIINLLRLTLAMADVGVSARHHIVFVSFVHNVTATTVNHHGWQLHHLVAVGDEWCDADCLIGAYLHPVNQYRELHIKAIVGAGHFDVAYLKPIACGGLRLRVVAQHYEAQGEN